MRRSHGRVVEVESRADARERRLESGARDLGGWRVRSVDLTGGLSLTDRRVAGSMFLGCRFETRGSPRSCRVVAPWSSPSCRTARSTSTAGALHRRGALRRRALPRQPRRPRLRVDRRRARGRDALLARRCTTTPSTRPWTSGWPAAPLVGGHGWSRGAARRAGVRRRGPARPAAGRGLVVATGGGRRHGGGEPRRPCRPRPASTTRWRGWPPCHYRPDVDAWAGAASRSWSAPRRAPNARHPDLALRPRAAERVRHGDREVRPQRHARGDPARDLRRRDRVPARAGGTVQEVFQDACENYYADERRSRRWCSSGATTGPRRCRPGRCCSRSPRAADGAARAPRRLRRGSRCERHRNVTPRGHRRPRVGGMEITRRDLFRPPLPPVGPPPLGGRRRRRPASPPGRRRDHPHHARPEARSAASRTPGLAAGRRAARRAPPRARRPRRAGAGGPRQPS